MASQFDISSLPVNGPDSYVSRMECVLTAVAGDALGWMTESVRDVGQLRNRFADWLTYYRDWSKPEGGRRCSDDTQLTLDAAELLRGGRFAGRRPRRSRSQPGACGISNFR